MDYFCSQHGETEIFRSQVIFVIVNIFQNQEIQYLQDYGYH